MVEPTYEEQKGSKLNIVVAGTEEGIVMVEAGACKPPKKKCWRPSSSATSAARRSSPVSRNWAKAGKPKREFTAPQRNETN